EEYSRVGDPFRLGSLTDLGEAMSADQGKVRPLDPVPGRSQGKPRDGAVDRGGLSSEVAHGVLSKPGERGFPLRVAPLRSGVARLAEPVELAFVDDRIRPNHLRERVRGRGTGARAKNKRRQKKCMTLTGWTHNTRSFNTDIMEVQSTPVKGRNP